jgi:hypothetical protein
VISQRVDSAPQHAEGLPAVDEVDVR